MKIYIIGSVGSGKTTLARQLACQLDIPHFETDNFVWKRQEGGDIRNSETLRDLQFVSAVEQADWIIEGVHIGRTKRALQEADAVVFLDFPYHTRTFRFISRYLKQKAGKEQSNYRPSLAMLRKMYGWNRYFEKVMKPEFMQQLKFFPEKTAVLTNQQEIVEFKAKFGRN
ncbi:DNA topology modulation protein FlaR [Planococcus soli]|uniref:DNA topology modulation protein FlaR n=1 Tax=Planococcus soli TaxID=2666072 RepID=UPI00115D8210|nr:DNA topology modulation protein FlaR [Planococcus soli]